MLCFLSTASKNKKSLTISAPIPCNTAFPPDHPGLSKLSVPDELAHRDADTRSGNTLPEESDSEDSSCAESSPSTPSRQSVCSESEGVKHHVTNGNAADAAEQPGNEHGHEEHASVSFPSEDTYTPEAPAEDEEDSEPEPAVAESIATTEREEETEHGEKEDGGGRGEREQSEELKKGPEATSQQTESSRPPGFLYKVSALAMHRLNSSFSHVVLL